MAKGAGESAAKLVIGDERGRGVRSYANANPAFRRIFKSERAIVSVTREIMPPEMIDVRVKDVWRGWSYHLEF